jgi:hypothetical protein
MLAAGASMPSLVFVLRTFAGDATRRLSGTVWNCMTEIFLPFSGLLVLAEPIGYSYFYRIVLRYDFRAKILSKNRSNRITPRRDFLVAV